jgi:hypothetical protein
MRVGCTENGARRLRDFWIAGEEVLGGYLWIVWRPFSIVVTAKRDKAFAQPRRYFVAKANDPIGGGCGIGAAEARFRNASTYRVGKGEPFPDVVIKAPSGRASSIAGF